MSQPRVHVRAKVRVEQAAYHGHTERATELLASAGMPAAPPTGTFNPAWMMTFLLAALRAPATSELSAWGEHREPTSDENAR